jgi:hypothetical protein
VRRHRPHALSERLLLPCAPDQVCVLRQARPCRAAGQAADWAAVVDWVRTLGDVKAALVGSGRPQGLRQPERGQIASCGRAGHPELLVGRPGWPWGLLIVAAAAGKIRGSDKQSVGKRIASALHLAGRRGIGSGEGGPRRCAEQERDAHPGFIRGGEEGSPRVARVWKTRERGSHARDETSDE